MATIALITAALIVGALIGAFGVGGVVLSPALIAVYGMGPHQATATALSCVIPSGFASAVTQRRELFRGGSLGPRCRIDRWQYYGRLGQRVRARGSLGRLARRNCRPQWRLAAGGLGQGRPPAVRSSNPWDRCWTDGRRGARVRFRAHRHERTGFACPDAHRRQYPHRGRGCRESIITGTRRLCGRGHIFLHR